MTAARGAGAPAMGSGEGGGVACIAGAAAAASAESTKVTGDAELIGCATVAASNGDALPGSAEDVTLVTPTGCAVGLVTAGEAKLDEAGGAEVGAAGAGGASGAKSLWQACLQARALATNSASRASKPARP